ncbi:translation initiation factor Sui1 [Chitinivorax sp. B]|uniref:translation initiation factor Sui1 n=1 Tax=Chitinivorax sp. B TaxID=2502235 RepID=UPI0010F5B7E1|nr:translation initiation factor Sui1 [Chitinivorax sp. B]
MSNSRPVYSTEHGRLCPGCGQPVNACCCRKAAPPSGDGVIRLRRETGGRGGKTVTTATGFLLDDNALKQLAVDLKRKCGTGGAVKDRIVEIQGDHRELLKTELEKRGFIVKLAGG